MLMFSTKNLRWDLIILVSVKALHAYSGSDSCN